MRSELEVRENLEWLTTNCRHYRDEEQTTVVNQLATLLWVLGADRTAATADAEVIWTNSRSHRLLNSSDY